MYMLHGHSTHTIVHTLGTFSVFESYYCSSAFVNLVDVHYQNADDIVFLFTTDNSTVSPSPTEITGKCLFVYASPFFMVTHVMHINCTIICDCIYAHMQIAYI